VAEAAASIKRITNTKTVAVAAGLQRGSSP
jgi:hypothetical protein